MPTNAKRVQAVFLAAVEAADPAARVGVLDRECGADTEMRLRVEVLLRAHDTEASILDGPALAGAIGTESANPTDTLAELSGAEGDRHELDFLQPPTRPDSLGRLGHYEVLEVLGRGGFGIVFRAFDDVLQRAVAFKVLYPQLAATSPGRKRFLREARSSAKVRHESLVQVYAVEELPLPYLVMEFIPGETLQQRLDRTGPLKTLEAVQIGRQIAEGLAAAHGMGLIHRDIKPANILLEAGPEPRVKITDFGLARAADDASLTQSGFVAGTPMFMAPEQASGGTLDHRADLFSLGSVLYLMCTGQPPFRANGTLAVLKRVAEDTPRPIPEIIPEAPPWLCDIISRLHAKRPEDRFASAKEVADQLTRRLDQLLHPATVEASPVAPPTAAEKRPPAPEIAEPAAAVRPRSRTGRWAAAAAVLLILLGGLGFTEATGVTNARGTVIRLFSPEGTLVVEVDDPTVSVKIDGSELVITGAGAKEIRLKPGQYKVEASKDGKVVRQELVTVTCNGRRVVRVGKESVPLAEAERWERSVAEMPAEQQVKAVVRRLKELNPAFDGTVTPTIEDGVVRGLAFRTDDVKDISPVRVLSRLRSLKCSGGGASKSPLMDLSPLKGLPLTTLWVVKGQLNDLAPLKGMPLTEFKCHDTSVSDLSPLKGMNLTLLNCAVTRVSDLTPLSGMPLETLDLSWTKAKDATALAGLQPEVLALEGTPITDLAPLKGMKLRSLNLRYTRVSDLSPLKGMKLTWLAFSDTPVSDLSPLNGMPLLVLHCGATKVSDEGLANFKDCKDLTYLTLRKTKVTAAGIDQLKEALPKCKIEWDGGVIEPR